MIGIDLVIYVEFSLLVNVVYAESDRKRKYVLNKKEVNTEKKAKRER